MYWDSMFSLQEAAIRWKVASWPQEMADISGPQPQMAPQPGSADSKATMLKLTAGRTTYEMVIPCGVSRTEK